MTTNRNYFYQRGCEAAASRQHHHWAAQDLDAIIEYENPPDETAARRAFWAGYDGTFEAIGLWIDRDNTVREPEEF